MARDIRIPVMTTPETYVAWHLMCEEAGTSMSSATNVLIVREIAAYAQRTAEANTTASAKEAQP